MKFYFTAAPLALLAEFLGVMSHQSLSRFHNLMVVATISLFFVMLSFVGMNLSFGAYFSNFKESNPIKVASSQGATLTFLFTILFLIFLVAVLVIPLENYFGAMINGGQVQTSGMYWALGVIVAVSLVVLMLSTVIGQRALKRDL